MTIPSKNLVTGDDRCSFQQDLQRGAFTLDFQNILNTYIDCIQDYFYFRTKADERYYFTISWKRIVIDNSLTESRDAVLKQSAAGAPIPRLFGR